MQCQRHCRCRHRRCHYDCLRQSGAQGCDQTRIKGDETRQSTAGRGRTAADPEAECTSGGPVTLKSHWRLLVWAETPTWQHATKLLISADAQSFSALLTGFWIVKAVTTATKTLQRHHASVRKACVGRRLLWRQPPKLVAEAVYELHGTAGRVWGCQPLLHLRCAQQGPPHLREWNGGASK